jgi:DNA-binding PadR family transcriptional regulator
MFEQGDLKYVILRLLDEKPRHGYEIIKELEDRFGGAYSPSPGTVYPTLTMLEDLGYAQATVEEGGRKIYAITDAGRAYLAEHSETVDGIFERVSRFVEGFLDEPMMEVNGAFRRLGRATYATASRHVRDAERLKKLREILDRAAREIDELDRPAEAGPAGL